MRARTLVPLLGLLLPLGCTPTLRDGQFTCSTEIACPPGGFSCVGGSCRLAFDASSDVDAAVRMDVGLDAAARVDVGFDAQTGVDVWTGGCDPITGTGCAGMLGCTLSASDGEPTCGMSGTIGVGMACVAGTCVAGAVCASEVCRAVCLVGASGSCAASCVPFAMGSTYGYCTR